VGKDATIGPAACGPIAFASTGAKTACLRGQDE
jgi:hypothetical protein